MISEEGGGWGNKKYIPAQLLSHFIVQLNIFLPEASHGVLTDGGRKLLGIPAVKQTEKRLECWVYLVYFPPYLARVSTALVFRHFGADVRPLHTSPTDIISYPGPESRLS